MNKAAEAFRTIGEVADELDVPKHVLRFWEGKFPQIRPMKRGGGRRYYRPEDMELLRGIRHLLHAEGYTIKGVQKILREQGIEQVKTLARTAMAAAHRSVAKRTAARTDGAQPPSGRADPSSVPERAAKAVPVRGDIIKSVIAELEQCRALLAASMQTAPEEMTIEPKRARAGGRT